MPLLCWLALVVDGYDLVANGATLPGLQAPQPWAGRTAAAAATGSFALVGS